MTANDEAIWLAKSSGHILGPFSKNQIEELLRTRELVPLDEVSLPMKRWNYIRDLPEFIAIVEELRQKEFKGDDHTETVGFSDEQTLSVTERATPSPVDVTQKVDMPEVEQQSAEIVYEDVQEVVTPNKTKRPSAKAYGTVEQAQYKAKSFSKYIWRAVVGVIVLMVSWVLLHKFVITPKKDEEKVSNLNLIAYNSYKMGDYEEALETYKKAFELDPTSEHVFLNYGVLLISENKQTLEGKRLLDRVKTNESYKPYSLTGLSLANLIDGHISQSENNLKAALSKEAGFVPAIINLANTRIAQRKYGDAVKLLKQAISLGLEDNAAYILIANAQLKMHRATQDVNYLKKAKTILNGFVRANNDYRQEAYVLSSYINYLLKDKAGVEGSIKALFSIDPNLTRMHKHDPLVYREYVSWGELVNYCLKIPDDYLSGSQVAAYKAYCLIMAKDLPLAKEKIEMALAQNPKDPINQSVYYLVLKESGQEDTAVFALSRAMEERGQQILPLYLQAWFCVGKQDWQCAKDNWKSILKVSEQDLSANVGKTQANFELGVRVGLEIDLESARKVSGHYKPLLKVSSEYENSRP